MWILLLIIFVIWATPSTILLFELIFFETKFRYEYLIYKLVYFAWLICLPLFQYIPFLSLLDQNIEEKLLFGFMVYWVLLIIESLIHMRYLVTQHKKETHDKAKKKVSKDNIQSRFSSPKVAWYSISITLLYILTTLQLVLPLTYPPYFYLCAVIITMGPQAYTVFQIYKNRKQNNEFKSQKTN